MPHIKDASGAPVPHTRPFDDILANQMNQNVDSMNAASVGQLNPVGVSATDMSQVSGGVLNTLPAYQQALTIANQVYQDREPLSPALLSLMYFSKLAEESSKPGATLLGAAGAAAATPAAYLMEERKQQRADEKAKGTLAATLTTTLTKAPAKANAYSIKDKPNEIVYYTPREFAALTPESKANLVPYKADTSTGKAARYTINNADEVNKILGTDFQQGTIQSLTPSDFAKVPRGSLSLADKPSSGALQERNLNFLIENADAIRSGNASPNVKAEYSAKFQMLVSGTEKTIIEDGVEKTIRIPGIDLSKTGLPVPEGFDAEKVISSRRQKFDQNQQNSATFGARMLQNEGAVRDALDGGYVVNIADIKKIRALEILGFGAIGLSPEAQKFHAAASNWVAAQLRQESGAAIGPKEYADALVQYFPQAGDSNEVIQSKRALRETATRGMINSAGDAFNVMYPDAVPYLTFKRGEETFKILNPKGYYTQRMQQTLRGQDLYFEDSLTSMSVDELKAMLAAPNAGTRYTERQLELISAEIDRKEQ